MGLVGADFWTVFNTRWHRSQGSEASKADRQRSGSRMRSRNLANIIINALHPILTDILLCHKELYILNTSPKGYREITLMDQPKS